MKKKKRKVKKKGQKGPHILVYENISDPVSYTHPNPRILEPSPIQEIRYRR